MERKIDKLRQSSRQLVWVLALTLVAALPAFAQFERGRISGTIKDAQGGVMPGVTVTATSQQTQQAVSVTTDASGFYNFANLTPGRYNMNAELQGFKKVVRNDVQLDAADARSTSISTCRPVADRRSDRHRGSRAAADRRRAPQDR